MGWKTWLIVIFGIVFVATPILFTLFYDPLDADVPQEVCTMKCGFAYSLKAPDVEGGTLTVIGYNDYPRNDEDKEKFKIGEKVFSETELNNLKTGKKDANGDERIKGEIDARKCIYMGFNREIGFPGHPTLETKGGESLVMCE